jgi:dihydroorotate dehydrogenase
MSYFYRRFVLPAIDVAALYDRERAHERAVRWLCLLGQDPILRAPVSLFTTPPRGFSRNVFGLHFPNPIGIASGFDKHGIAARGLEHLGFGFVMSGTVVLRPQKGNARPRVFRFADGIINRYGFNSVGADNFCENLRLFGRPSVPYGISVGPNKDAVSDHAAEDIIEIIITVYRFGDFFVVNVSSPNTPGLRDLQDPVLLEALLCKVQMALQQLAKENGGTKKPLLVKLSPDMDQTQLGRTLEACEIADGIIFSNTTVNKPRSIDSRYYREPGGFSGPSQFTRTLDGVIFIKKLMPHKPLIAVGGIDAGWKATALLDEGADLLKLYTGLVLNGPGLPSKILRDMWKRGFESEQSLAA